MKIQVTKTFSIENRDQLNWSIIEETTTQDGNPSEKHYGYFPTPLLAAKTLLNRILPAKCETAEQFNEILDKLIQLEIKFK